MPSLFDAVVKTTKISKVPRPLEAVRPTAPVLYSHSLPQCMLDPPGGLQPWPSDQQGQEQGGRGLGSGALYQAATRRPAITDRSTLEPFFAASSSIQRLENSLFLGMCLQQCSCGALVNVDSLPLTDYQFTKTGGKLHCISFHPDFFLIA